MSQNTLYRPIFPLHDHSWLMQWIYTVYICFVEYGPRTTLTPEQWRWLRSRGLSTSPSHEWLLSERWATMETPRRRISTQSYDPFLAWQVTDKRASASLVGLPSLPTANYLHFSDVRIVPSGIVPNFTAVPSWLNLKIVAKATKILMIL